MTFAPRTWVVGEVVTGAVMNQEIRDQFNSMFDTWTGWTPTWTAATTNPALGNGSMTGRYMKWGRTCMVNLELTMGSTTTYGAGVWSFSLPFTAASAVGSRVGMAQALGGSNRAAGQLIVAPAATTLTCFFPASTSVSFLSNNGATNPFTWAATHQLRASFTYETAT
ncbi:hypothetical protein OOK13_40220 [Streptomyces sp. NBC_00378]|uniref:hypothetical protein n=1 Tax=unclassified Streptomyces TaxID=2593676 RepID=UPI0022538BB2|nr:MULTISPECIES: hypothetical protein [unclassified Streptomyces]MCX5114588.1 hypothetical protein [Streptomyces sp. NBC_00378]